MAGLAAEAKNQGGGSSQGVGEPWFLDPWPSRKL